MPVFRSDPFDKVFMLIHSSEMGFQHDVAILHLNLQIVLCLESNSHRDTFRDSNRQAIPQFLCRCFHMPTYCVDTTSILMLDG